MTWPEAFAIVGSLFCVVLLTVVGPNIEAILEAWKTRNRK